MEDTYLVPRKVVDTLACTAQVVAEHLEHGYTTRTDAKQLKDAVSDLESAVRRPAITEKTDSQRSLWGD
jgi:hypothetical protein